MSFLRRMFGKKSNASEPPALTPPPASPPPPGAPATLKVWDAYGRICEIPREEWRTKVLPGNFRGAWSKPDELANLISATLNDGFIADCLEPARQLHRIDSDPKRGATFLVVVLIYLKQWGEAEEIVLTAMRQHGEDGVLMTNLAKAQAGQGHKTLSESTLWHALELDPNQDNGLLWYQAIFRERDGEAGAEAAFRRVAALAGSWRAQLWLARSSIEARNLEQALAFYRESLSRVQKPIPADLLSQISGDLGNAGHLPEILQLVGPHFDVADHGLEVGVNLIKTNVDLGQLDTASRILSQLYAQGRPDWKGHLGYWDTEIAKARLPLHQGFQERPTSVMLTIAGPVWLKPESPAAELFPAKPADAPTVTLIGSAAEFISNSRRAEHQLADGRGRMSRALPLFLAEQIEFHSEARVQSLFPWVTGEAPAFAFVGASWEDGDAALYTQQSENSSDYVVTVFLKPNAETWSVELRLVRTIDAQCLGTVTGGFREAQPEAGIPVMADQLLALLREKADVQPVPPPSPYQIPVGSSFGSYLLRLEQLLAVRCAGMDGVPSTFLSGERDIVDGNLQLCLEYPQNEGVRILFVQLLIALKRARPKMLPEYREKVARLQREIPLRGSAQSVLQRMINGVWEP
ncbi:MAG TPA: hypothetical protein VMF06_10180 [Candidatus Limnocylindria bacterium]|nr:hypothetical protein [Candidatus Limnocylindria bacterium]